MLNIGELTQKLRPLEKSRLRDVGDLLQYFIPWAGLLAVALQGDKLAAWLWLNIGLTNAVVTQLLKYLFDFTRFGMRPDGGKGAMPSGHTSSAFMGASFIHFQFGFSYAILAYILAGITGYSRIVAKRHWPRDVIIGAILAILICFTFFNCGECRWYNIIGLFG